MPSKVYVRRHRKRSPRISRFEGIETGIPGIRAGGGMRGATKELDDVVQEAAKRLAAHYGRDVQIRFNFDRRSGGAYITMPSGIEIGIGAGLYKLPEPGTTLEKSPLFGSPEWEALPEVILYDARIWRGHTLLREHEGHPRTLDEAFKWLTSEVRRTPQSEQARL